jgi:isoleucyl-tRNA synthetase
VNYTIQYKSTNDNGSVSTWTSFASSSSLEDETSKLAEEYRIANQDDPNFQIVRVFKQSDGNTDYEMIDRMRAAREACELGHRVRADAKIRNRQPLSTAYILFSNSNVHDYMVYLDNKTNEYADILGEELNVDNVVFIQDAKQFTDVNLKPNFRVLGKKGFGKQAQGLKTELGKMTIDQKRELHNALERKDQVFLCGIDLVLADLEVELTPKQGFASASSKGGVVVLDTTLTPELLDRGWVSDFKSALQNIRKDIGLELTDRVFVEVWCNNKKHIDLLDKHSTKLKKELLANDIALFRTEWLDKQSNKSELRSVVIDGVECRVSVWKE